MTLLQKLSGGRSRVLILSGANAPVLEGGGSGHSILAQALLDGLVNTKEEAFLARELFDTNLLLRIARAIEQEAQYRPITGARHEAGDFFFVRSED